MVQVIAGCRRAKALVVRVWTIADFRDNGSGIRQVCARFVALSHLGLFTEAVIAIDGSKFKAMSNRDENPRTGFANLCFGIGGRAGVTICWYRIERISAVLGRAAAMESGCARLA